MASTEMFWMCTSLAASRACPSAWEKGEKYIVSFQMSVSCTLISMQLVVSDLQGGTMECSVMWKEGN